MSKTAQYILFWLITATFAAFLLWPILRVVRVGFFGVPGTASSGFTLAYINSIFLDHNLRRGLLNSTLIAICVTIVCTLISVPLATLNQRYTFPGKTIVGSLLLVPLILPPFVGAIGMRQILGRFGVLTSISQHLGFVGGNTPIDWIGAARLGGIVLIEALSLYPILYLNVSAALANLDPAMEQAAANLGASRWMIFRKITLPLMRPGLFAGGTIVLIWSFTELGTPLMFDYYRVTPVQVFHQLTQVSGSPVPYALVVVMLAASVLLYVVGKLVLGRRIDAAVTKASTQQTAIAARGGKGLLVLLPFAIVSGLALLPHLGVLLTSVAGVGTWYDSVLPKVFTTTHFRTALTHDVVMGGTNVRNSAILNSVTYAAMSVIVDIVLGLAIAYLIVRSRIARPFKAVLDNLSMLPLAVPGLVLAFGFVALSLQMQTWVGAGHPILSSYVDFTQNPIPLLVIAYAMRRLPYVVRSAVAGLEQTPIDLELAARNLGASGSRTMWRVTIPLISANIIAGGLLAFAFAMLEVSDSLILAQKQQYWPITKAIYELFSRLGDGPYIASALGVWAMALLTLTILSANSLLGKKMGAIFRV